MKYTSCLPVFQGCYDCILNLFHMDKKMKSTDSAYLQVPVVFWSYPLVLWLSLSLFVRQREEDSGSGDFSGIPLLDKPYHIPLYRNYRRLNCKNPVIGFGSILSLCQFRHNRIVLR